MAHAKIENDFLPPCDLCDYRYWEGLHHNYWKKLQNDEIDAIPENLVQKYYEAMWPYQMKSFNACPLCRQICRGNINFHVKRGTLTEPNPARRTRPPVTKRSVYVE